ncbi:hypothetical protein P7K49_015423, partial [Saguinus oedipus]
IPDAQDKYSGLVELKQQSEIPVMQACLVQRGLQRRAVTYTVHGTPASASQQGLGSG